MNSPIELNSSGPPTTSMEASYYFTVMMGSSARYSSLSTHTSGVRVEWPSCCDKRDAQNQVALRNTFFRTRPSR
jgi:hypothetical protein